jgi:NAD(P)-dependent dehydrogenase (short-subunit alcohol dehydrogenase family)
MVAVVIIAVFMQVAHRKIFGGSRILKGTMPYMLVNQNFEHGAIPDLKGKTVVVTGANVGLGKSTAKFFALNGARTIMTCRTLLKGENARQTILDELVLEGRVKANDVDRVQALLVPMVLELSSLASVKHFADSFLSKNSELHSLVLNAGIMHTAYGLTADGIEQQWGVNHLAHFYLAKLLTPALQKGQPSTVVSVASNGQFGTYEQGVFLTLNEINDEPTYNPLLAYGQSKLSNVIFAQELGARFKAAGDQIFVNSMNPGGVNTNLFREYPDFAQKAFRFILSTLPDTFIFEPDTAALTSLYLAVSPSIIEKQVSSTYFVPIGDPCDTSDHAKNETLQAGLWKFSEDLLKLKGFQ